MYQILSNVSYQSNNKNTIARSCTPIFIPTVPNNSKKILTFFGNFLYAVYVLLIKSKRKDGICVFQMLRQPKSNANHRPCHSWLQSQKENSVTLIFQKCILKYRKFLRFM